MELMNKIQEDARKALKGGNRDLSDTLKYLYSLLQTAAARQKDFTYKDAIAVLQREMKAKKEALDLFRQGDRADLVKKEEEEIKVLEEYLPEMMSEEEIKDIVEKTISGLNNPNFGQVMGMVMGKFGSEADGELVAKIVREKLK